MRVRLARALARSLNWKHACVRFVSLARSLNWKHARVRTRRARARLVHGRDRSRGQGHSRERAHARERVEQALMARLALAARRRGLRGRRLLSQPAWRSGVVPEQTRRCQPHDIMSTARMRRARTRVRARERARRGSSEQRSGARPPRGACCALDEELVAGHDVEHHAEHEPPRARRARRRDAAAAAVVGRHHRNGSRAAQRAPLQALRVTYRLVKTVRSQWFKRKVRHFSFGWNLLPVPLLVCSFFVRKTMIRTNSACLFVRFLFGECLAFFVVCSLNASTSLCLFNFCLLKHRPPFIFLLFVC